MSLIDYILGTHTACGERYRNRCCKASLLEYIGILCTREFTRFNRFERGLLTIVSKNSHLTEKVFGLEDIHCAQRHLVIHTINARDIRVGDQQRGQHILRGLTAPIRGLVGNNFNVRILLQTFLKPVRALVTDDDSWRCVENHHITFAAHDLAHLVGNRNSAKIVIHFDM